MTKGGPGVPGGAVVAVASIYRDRESLEAEAAVERVIREVLGHHAEHAWLQAVRAARDVAPIRYNRGSAVGPDPQEVMEVWAPPERSGARGRKP